MHSRPTFVSRVIAFGLVVFTCLCWLASARRSLMLAHLLAEDPLDRRLGFFVLAGFFVRCAFQLVAHSPTQANKCNKSTISPSAVQKKQKKIRQRWTPARVSIRLASIQLQPASGRRISELPPPFFTWSQRPAPPLSRPLLMMQKQ